MTLINQEYTKLKVAVFGCGSIGQRHIRNLLSLGVTDIIALRSRQGHFQQIDSNLNVKEVYEWSELIDSKPDIALIANPTSYHLETATKILPYVKGLFIEKPLAVSLDGVEQLLLHIKKYRVTSFVGYNFQFHKVTEVIQNLLANSNLGNPLVFQCQVGQWLPDWHPYENYLESYSARQELGGGVSLTLIHEIHLAVELLGTVKGVFCLLPNSSLLPLEVDAIADFMTQHASGAVSQIHLDYIQQPFHRRGVISCERGWISYDLLKPKVTAQLTTESEPSVIWENLKYDTNIPYIEQMRTFLSYVTQGLVRHEFDAWKAVQSLAIVDTAFKAARLGYFMELPNWIYQLEEL